MSIQKSQSGIGSLVQQREITKEQWTQIIEDSIDALRPHAKMLISDKQLWEIPLLRADRMRDWLSRNDDAFGQGRNSDLEFDGQQLSQLRALFFVIDPDRVHPRTFKLDKDGKKHVWGLTRQGKLFLITISFIIDQSSGRESLDKIEAQLATVEDIVNIDSKQNNPRFRWLELKGAAESLVIKRTVLLEKAERVYSFFEKQDAVIDLVNG